MLSPRPPSTQRTFDIAHVRSQEEGAGQACQAPSKGHDSLCTSPDASVVVRYAPCQRHVSRSHSLQLPCGNAVIAAQPCTLAVYSGAGFHPLSRTEVTRDFRDLTGAGPPADVRGPSARVAALCPNALAAEAACLARPEALCCCLAGCTSVMGSAISGATSRDSWVPVGLVTLTSTSASVAGGLLRLKCRTSPRHAAGPTQPAGALH